MPPVLRLNHNYKAGAESAKANNGLAVFEHKFELKNNTDKPQTYRFYHSSIVQLSSVSGVLKPKSKIEVTATIKLHVFSVCGKFAAIYLENDPKLKAKQICEIHAYWWPPFSVKKCDEFPCRVQAISGNKTMVDLHTRFNELNQTNLKIECDPKWLVASPVNQNDKAFLQISALKPKTGCGRVTLRHKPSGHSEKILVRFSHPG